MADPTSDIGRRFPVRPSPWEQSQPILDRIGHWLWDMPAQAGSGPVPAPSGGAWKPPADFSSLYARPAQPPPDSTAMLDSILRLPPARPPETTAPTPGVQATTAPTPGVPVAPSGPDAPAPEVTPTAAVAPPAQAAPQQRPTVIYRSEPGTREFVFPSRGIGAVDDSGDDFLKQQYAAGADTLRMMQDMGGTPLNSPQLRAGNEQQAYLMDAMTKQLSGRANLAQAQAQQSQAQAQQAETEGKYGPEGQRLAYTNTPGAIQAAPERAAELGLHPGAGPLFNTLGVGPKDTLATATQRYLGAGKGPIVPGSPWHSAFLQQYGPEIDAGLSGNRYGLLDTAARRAARAETVGKLGLQVQPQRSRIGARTSDRQAEIERTRRGQ